MAGLITLGLVLALALYLCWLILQPFVNVILWAAVLAVVFFPLHKRIRERVGSASGAAGISTLLVVVLILLPLLVLMLTWLPARLRYAREAGAIVELMRRGTHGDLLALRALTGRRVNRLAKLHIDPAGAWRRGDPDDIKALAQLELAEFGLRPR